MQTTFEIAQKAPLAEPVELGQTAWGRLLHRLRDRMAPPALTPLSRRELLQTTIGLFVGLALTAGLVAAIVLPSALRRLPQWDIIPLLALPLIWSVSFSLYAVRTLAFGMRRTPRLDRIAQSPYLPRVFLEYGYWMFTLPIAVCVRLGVTPNQITYATLVVTAVAALGFATGRFGFAGWALFLAFMMDAWDGIVARATNKVSTSGAFLDSTIDRYNDSVAYLGIMYYYRNDLLPLLLCAGAMVGSTVVSYARAKGAAVGHDPNVGHMQRHERAVWLGIGAVCSPILAAFVEPAAAHPQFHLMIVALLVVAATTNYTAVWRIREVMGWLQRQAEQKAPAATAAPPAAPRPSERPAVVPARRKDAPAREIAA
ncbi:MAG: CDP-alcohol phosphatidyltransferase family protein [Deltaproteobacteria bacterium]|nr:CDP-alcohol phosphatidyltransferase family protein [Deltaproteobacteria bacterium]